MTKKTQYPGGVKLTLKKARAVAIQEFGTAKGLAKEEPAPFGYFTMEIGNLYVRIHPDTYGETGCIVVSAEMAHGTGQSLKFLDPETLQDNFDALEKRRREDDREALNDWVNSNGPEFCHKQIDRAWERG
ncbi:MAG: hypothetical protein MSK39_01265 [Dysosmobacter sp.]|nr:hypothetical protein [Dysosmobacter sp.]